MTMAEPTDAACAAADAALYAALAAYEQRAAQRQQLAQALSRVRWMSRGSHGVTRVKSGSQWD